MIARGLIEQFPPTDDQAAKPLEPPIEVAADAPTEPEPETVDELRAAYAELRRAYAEQGARLAVYGPLRHPKAPSLSLTGFRLVVDSTTLWGLPCCVRFPCVHAVATTPAQRLGG
jgi:hypothetical protein